MKLEWPLTLPVLSAEGRRLADWTFDRLKGADPCAVRVMIDCITGLLVKMLRGGGRQGKANDRVSLTYKTGKKRQGYRPYRD
jgi:hypothetical protein